jgi:general secretion pathway protein L
MAGTFYLRLPSDLDAGIESTVQWYSPDSGLPSVEEGTLEHAGLLTVGYRVVVVVPATEVLILESDIPTRKRQRILKALPFVLEEQLAEDVEQLHFAIVSCQGAEKVTAAVISKQRMASWLTLLQQVGIHPQQMVPESLVLPLHNGEWSLLADNETVLLRTAECRGYALPASVAAESLLLALEQCGDEKPAKVSLFTDKAGDYPEGLEQQLRDAGVEVVEKAEINLLERFPSGSRYEPPIDLLQGDFSRKEQIGKIWRPWRAAAILLLVILLLQGGIAIQEYYQLSSEEAELTTAIEQIYRKTFPDARKVVDPKVQMEQRLAELRHGGSGGGFLGLLSQAGPIIKQAQGIGVESLRYNQSVLEIELLLADFQVLDKLKQALIQGGLSVNITTANAQDGKVRSQLRIQGAGA